MFNRVAFLCESMPPNYLFFKFNSIFAIPQVKRRLLSLGVHADGMPGKLTILLHVDASIRGAALQELEQWWKLISLARFLELPICPDESVSRASLFQAHGT